jgi:deazaflavin-dependent oxidoreductase (nitroreductase family)
MDATPTTESVPPSALVRATMRHMVKVLNPLVAKLAGTRFMSMAALVTHTGRRSGRQYSTPVGAHVSGTYCLVPLTFGTGSDWSKNLRAAGGGRLQWRARVYEVSAPEVYLAKDVLPLIKATFSAPVLLGLKMMGIKSFLYMQAALVAQ